MDRRFIARIHRIPRAYAFVTLLTVLLALFVNFVDAMLIGAGGCGVGRIP